MASSLPAFVVPQVHNGDTTATGRINPGKVDTNNSAVAVQLERMRALFDGILRGDDQLRDQVVRLWNLHPEIGALFYASNGLPVVGTFAWKQPVLAYTNDVPESPSVGDRYLVGEAPGDAWLGKEGHIVQYAVVTGVGQWLSEGTPADGWYVFVQEELAPYGYSGGQWLANGGARGFGQFVVDYIGLTSGVPGGAGQHIELTNSGPVKSFRGLMLSLSVVSTQTVGVVTVRVFRNFNRTDLVAELVVDLATSESNWTTRDAAGFEATSDTKLYATVYSAGMPSGSVGVTLRAALLLIENYNPIQHQNLGLGLEQAGDGTAKIRLSSNSGLAVDNNGLRVKAAQSAVVRVVPSGEGLLVDGALATAGNQIATGQKLADGLGLTRRASKGPPTDGYWFQGVEIEDSEGLRWRCVQTGTPGSWDFAGNVTRWTSIIESSALDAGNVGTLIIPVDGRVGTVVSLRVWGWHDTNANTDFTAPLRLRVYPNTGLLGRELLWQGLMLARTTYLTAQALPSDGALTVSDNNQGEIDDLLLLSSNYYPGRISSRPAGQFGLDEPLAFSGSVLAYHPVFLVSEFSHIGFYNDDGNASQSRALILQVRNDSPSATIRCAAQALVHCAGLKR